MNYLLDTNVISEFSKPSPHPALISWFQHIEERQLFLSVLTLGELNKGLEKLPLSPRFEKLHQWLHSAVIERFGDRLLLLDQAISMNWGKLLASHPRSLPVIDSLLAATAITHELTLVTRNLKDFSGIEGLKVLNPFELS